MKNRYAFGKNWNNFLSTVKEEHILEAKKSIKKNIPIKNWKDKVFLDIGSGSGLFSLAAYELGAKVHSFDYDMDSVKCTLYLRDKYCKDKKQWTVEQGSVLDKKFLKKFKNIDIIYSWGVLHHTGSMYEAFANVVSLIKKEGYLFISIYNDQGYKSKLWTWSKKKYVNSNRAIKFLIISYTLLINWSKRFIYDLITSGNPLKTWSNYKKNRGMSAFHDVLDWAGGYPFEVAKPEEVFKFFRSKNFTLEYLKTCRAGLGCNEFIFKKIDTNNAAKKNYK